MRPYIRERIDLTTTVGPEPIRCQYCPEPATGSGVYTDHYGFPMQVWPVCADHAPADSDRDGDGHETYFSAIVAEGLADFDRKARQDRKLRFGY